MAAQPVQSEFDHASAARLPSRNDQERQLAPRQRPPENGKHSLNKQGVRELPDQNPELLHWRANVLLDEMMLGAIDIAANDSVPARALSHRPHPNNGVDGGNSFEASRQSDRYQRGSETAMADRAGALNGLSEYGAQPPTALSNGEAASAAQSNGALPWPSSPDTSLVADQGQPRQRADTTAPRAAAAQPRTAAGTAPAKAGEQPRPGNGTEQWLFAAEQRYQQLAARRQTGQESAATTPGYDSDGWSMAPDRPSQPGYGVVADDPYHRDSSYGQIPSYSASPISTVATATTPTAGKGAGTVRNGRKSLRSNLLPRMSALDSRTVQQEMATLQSNIEAVLPAGHESRTRAQHLLQKAYAILQEDPTRSAEVEYYLQQVRTIMHRSQETVHWSNLYQRRLRTYLLAWLALSIVVILSRYLYAMPLSIWLAGMGEQTSDSLWIYNILTITSAFFFGALGGGVGALFNMFQHTRLEHGFFDRKYGLRGLILPLIGALFGLSLCVIFGIFYAILGVDPASSLWFGLVPALLALVAGLSQEYLYGTREA